MEDQSSAEIAKVEPVKPTDEEPTAPSRDLAQEKLGLEVEMLTLEKRKILKELEDLEKPHHRRISNWSQWIDCSVKVFLCLGAVLPFFWFQVSEKEAKASRSLALVDAADAKRQRSIAIRGRRTADEAKRKAIEELTKITIDKEKVKAELVEVTASRNKVRQNLKEAKEALAIDEKARADIVQQNKKQKLLKKGILDVVIVSKRIGRFIEFKAESDQTDEVSSGHITAIGKRTFSWEMGNPNQDIWFWWDNLEGEAQITITFEGTTLFSGTCSHSGSGEVGVLATAVKPFTAQKAGSPHIEPVAKRSIAYIRP